MHVDFPSLLPRRHQLLTEGLSEGNAFHTGRLFDFSSVGKGATGRHYDSSAGSDERLLAPAPMSRVGNLTTVRPPPAPTVLKQQWNTAQSGKRSQRNSYGWDRWRLVLFWVSFSSYWMIFFFFGRHESDSRQNRQDWIPRNRCHNVRENGLQTWKMNSDIMIFVALQCDCSLKRLLWKCWLTVSS